MINQSEIVVAIPGSVLGLGANIKDWLINLAKDNFRRKLHVFIHAWDFWENRAWLEDFIDSFDVTNKIKFHVEFEKYNSPEAFSIQKNFFRDTCHNSASINFLVGKRVWYWYSLCKVLKMVDEYSKDVWIQTLHSDMKAPRLPDGTFDNYFFKWHEKISIVKAVACTPDIAKTDNNNILYVGSSSTYCLKEETILGHIDAFKKVLHDFNIKKLISALTEMYLQYFEDAEIELPKSENEVRTVFVDPFILPNEASVFLFNLWKPHESEIKILEFPYFFKGSTVENPWFTIMEDSIQVVHPFKIISFDLMGQTEIVLKPKTIDKFKNAKDNTRGFIRRNDNLV